MSLEENQSFLDQMAEQMATGNPAGATDEASDGPALSDEDRLDHLARLSPIAYDRERDKAAKAMGIRSATLDKMIRERRKDHAETDGIDFDEIDPWPHPIDGAELLAELSATVQRFIICPLETAHAAALWVVMTWFMDVVQVAPLAVITAPEKRCGKSQLLFLLGRLVHRPLAASNITPAALFRAVDAWKPTLLVDEAELARRRAQLPAPPDRSQERGYRKLFLSTVTQADQGCDFDFLRAAQMAHRVPKGKP